MNIRKALMYGAMASACYTPDDGGAPAAPVQPSDLTIAPPVSLESGIVEPQADNSAMSSVDNTKDNAEAAEQPYAAIPTTSDNAPPIMSMLAAALQIDANNAAIATKNALVPPAPHPAYSVPELSQTQPQGISSGGFYPGGVNEKGTDNIGSTMDASGRAIVGSQELIEPKVNGDGTATYVGTAAFEAHPNAHQDNPASGAAILNATPNPVGITIAPPTTVAPTAQVANGGAPLNAPIQQPAPIVTPAA